MVRWCRWGGKKRECVCFLAHILESFFRLTVALINHNSHRLSLVCCLPGWVKVELTRDRQAGKFRCFGCFGRARLFHTFLNHFYFTASLLTVFYIFSDIIKICFCNIFSSDNCYFYTKTPIFFHTFTSPFRVAIYLQIVQYFHRFAGFR